LGLGIISLLVLGLGLVGWLNRGSAIGLMLVGVTAAVGQVWRQISNQNAGFSSLKSRVSRRRAADWLWLILVPSAALTSVAACVPPGMLWGDEPHGYDVIEYHLQVPREWYESGRIEPLRHNVFSYFPFNVEMHYLLGMHLKGGPWNAMYLAHFMGAGMMVLAIVALVGIAGPQAAIAAAAVPWMVMLGSVAYNEAGVLLFATLSVGWALRALAAGTGQPMRELILAGALAGFACGVKLTAVPMLMLSVAVALLFPLRLRGRVGVGAITGYVLAGLITFSPWLIRNTVWTGNPVFPEATSIFGRAHFTGVQQQRWNKAHSATTEQRLKAPWTQLIGEWKYGFAVLPLALAGAALGRKRPTGFLVALLLLQFLIWIGFSHVQGRFMVLAIPIAAMLIGQVEWPRWNWVVIACAVVSIAVGWRPMIQRLKPGLRFLTTTDIHGLIPQVAADAMEAGRSLVLVGDARGFLYPIPTSRLRYRTVFDVDVAPGQSLIEAWIAGPRPDNATIIIYPSELERFAQTYWMIPTMSFPSSQPYALPE
jgi:hypothetical protein